VIDNVGVTGAESTINVDDAEAVLAPPIAAALTPYVPGLAVEGTDTAIDAEEVLPGESVKLLDVNTAGQPGNVDERANVREEQPAGSLSVTETVKLTLPPTDAFGLDDVIVTTGLATTHGGSTVRFPLPVAVDVPAVAVALTA
jgi:hypothetical protein